MRNHGRVTASVYSRAFLKAAELLGGRSELALLLQVAQADVDAWISGDANPPREVFLRVVDIILDETSSGGPDDTSESPRGRDAAGPSRYLD